MALREIIFRGKRLDNGEWVEGAFCPKNSEGDIPCIIVYNGTLAGWWFEVDPATVGQFTGLLDKAGKRVFEGDVFQDEDLTGVVKFRGGSFLLEWSGRKGQWTEDGFDVCGGEYGVVECEPLDFYYIHEMERTGNIHDNHELLEVTPDE